ncbi:MAG: hypothetical protein QXX38_02065 [Candidatus Aenigmatarchaeota archaeon]
MKGQMFLIAAIVIATGLLIARFTIKNPSIEEQRKILEMRYEKEFFENIREELENSIIFSSHQKENIANNVFDFSNFTKTKVSEHAMELKLLFLGSISNFSSQTLNITLLNLLNKKIYVELDLNGSKKGNDIEDYGRWDTSFTIIPGLNYVLTFKYDDYSNNITIRTSESKYVYNSFFDLTLIGFDAVYKRKFQSEYVFL